MKKKKGVKFMFPGPITHAGTSYQYGDIEENPDSYLLEIAAEKTKQFHRDTAQWSRVCKLVTINKGGDEDEEEYDEDELVERTPYKEGGFDGYDDLETKRKPELSIMAKSLGMQRAACKTLKKDQLVKTIRFLRTL